MRGYIKKLDEDYYWYDINDKPNKITLMETSYITNCIVLLERRLGKQKFPENSATKSYIDIFNEELALRAQVRSTKIGRLVYV